MARRAMSFSPAHVDHGIGEVELDLDAGAQLGKTGEQSLTMRSPC